MIGHPFAESFTILSEQLSGQDGDDNDVYTPVEVSANGTFAPEGSTVLIQGQTTVLDHDTVYLNDGEPTPKETDRMRVRGLIYNIDGTPALYLNTLTGYQPGAVVRLLKVSG